MEERGVEPLAVKLLAGLVLLAVGLGVGLSLYRRAETRIEHFLDFDLRLEKSELSLQLPKEEDHVVFVSVYVEPIMGYEGTVRLEAEAPKGVLVTFEPAEGKCPFASSMQIRVTPSAGAGTYNITVRAKSGGYQKAKYLKLILS